jgi:hypothetical protein
MKSTLFLSNLSIVDHAYINSKGQIIGGSYNPSFMVSGTVDVVENVVVDFSTIKHDLKKHIDKHIADAMLNGFDHKLWIIEGYSECSVQEQEFEDRTIISSDAFYGQFPTDAVKYITNPSNEEFSDAFIGKRIAAHLTECLAPQYPDVEIVVECINNTDAHLVDDSLPIAFFRYSHGLKDSTSYGCQNPGHGHLSFIQHWHEGACLKIAADLHNAVFINTANIISDTDESLVISYSTPQRGLSWVSYKKAKNKIVVLDTETTIEHIAEFVAAKYDIADFYISEGLSKGVYFE